MSSFYIRLKDDRYRGFLMNLLSRLEFIEVSEQPDDQPVAQSTKVPHRIFDSAGLWEDYEIDQDTLRQAAWKR